jgi:3-oxoacyl-[acyl-carrier protein] reductase
MAQRCAVATGGARNIDHAIGRRLQKDGYRVIALDIVASKEPSLQPDARIADLPDAAAPTVVITGIAADMQVKCLVNNVGIAAPALFDEVEVADFDKLMHLSVPIATGRQGAGPGHAARGRRADRHGHQPRHARQRDPHMRAGSRPGRHYRKLRRTGADCEDSILENNPPNSDYTKTLIAGVPLRRMGRPEDVTNTVSSFCDDKASIVTG